MKNKCKNNGTYRIYIKNINIKKWIKFRSTQSFQNIIQTLTHVQKYSKYNNYTNLGDFISRNGFRNDQNAKNQWSGQVYPYSMGGKAHYQHNALGPVDEWYVKLRSMHEVVSVVAASILTDIRTGELRYTIFGRMCDSPINRMYISWYIVLFIAKSEMNQ